MTVFLPPMGISLAKAYNDDITQKIALDAADKMVELGLVDAGYEYLIIGDAWCKPTRDENGNLVEDTEKFPDGIKYLSDALHAKGVKLGITTSIGVLTPNGYPGSFEREYADAETFAKLGVDYIAHTDCDIPAKGGFFTPLRRMNMALRATGKDIFYALQFDMDNIQKRMYYTGYEWDGADLSEYTNGYAVEKWMRSTGVNSFCTKSAEKPFDAKHDDKFLGYTGTQCWLSLGDIAVENECCCALKKAISACAVKCSPIIIDVDPAKLTDSQVDVMKNAGVIRILKDEESRSPAVISANKGTIYTKLLTDREYAVLVVNDSDKDEAITFCTFDFGLVYNSGLKCDMYDVFTNEKHPLFDDATRIKVKANGSRLFIMKLV